MDGNISNGFGLGQDGSKQQSSSNVAQNVDVKVVETSQVYKVLASRKKIAVLEALQVRPASPSVLEGKLAMKAKTIEKHLREMKVINLVEKVFGCYQLTEKGKSLLNGGI